MITARPTSKPAMLGVGSIVAPAATGAFRTVPTCAIEDDAALPRLAHWSTSLGAKVVLVDVVVVVVAETMMVTVTVRYSFTIV